jgi:CRP/FNR family transcriptional regulator, cyclic AMP receptor protein
MDDLDFSKPPGPQRPAAPAPTPRPVYNAAVAMDFFRAGGRAESVPAGTRFFEENEKAGFLRRDKMYLLLEGDVSLTARGKPIGRVKVGEIFGEMAAISDSPRTATALARTPCRVIALDDKDFQKALKAKPEFALMLMGMMVERLRAMLARAAPRGGSAPASADGSDSRVFDKAMLSALAKGLGPEATVRHPAGTALFREGSVGALAYVVLDGRVAVTIQGRPVQTIGPGGIFGEMALVDQSTRAASATAQTDVALVAVGRNVFLNLVRANPAFGSALLNAVAERVRFIADGAK